MLSNDKISTGKSDKLLFSCFTLGLNPSRSLILSLGRKLIFLPIPTSISMLDPSVENLGCILKG